MTSCLFQDPFDVQILMARSVKHCINFMEAKQEDLHRLDIICKCFRSMFIYSVVEEVLRYLV